MHRVIFFVNPIRAARGKRRASIERCVEVLRAEGCNVEIRDTRQGDGATEQARQAVKEGFDTIFACGGDGTMFLLLQGVAGSQTALGVIPIGTGNVLAQNLKLPRDPVAAFQLQRKAEVASIPLGEAVCADENGHQRTWYFTIAAGVGMHAALMNRAPHGAGKRLWGRTAYYFGALRLIATRAVQHFEAEVMQSRRFRASELLAVRVPMINRWRAGGDLRSPHLRIASIPPTGRGGLAHACFHALARTTTKAEQSLLGLPYPRYEDAAQVVCESPGAPLLVQADGEVIGSGRAIFRISEKRLRLLWPNP